MTDDPQTSNPAPTTTDRQRRKLLRVLARSGLATWAAASIAVPAIAAGRGPLAAMTEGPFYPPKPWRERWPDWDADLTVVRGGSALQARGERLDLQAEVVDSQGRAMDHAEVEIWQCDALGIYHHPAVRDSGDPGFAGFGAARTDASGKLRFRTIKPVPYPGRTPHIHVRLRHPTFGELTSQLFVAGDAGNARDFLWRSVPATERAAIEMQLRPAPANSGATWLVQHSLVVPV